jgi:hypothetical protein
MYCPHCREQLFGGSVCHYCGKSLVEKERQQTTDASPETSYLKKPLQIATRRKHRVTKEFGQTLPGHLVRLLLEILLFCAIFFVLSIAVVHVANWLSVEMALPGQKAKHIDLQSRWMKYFWFIGCAAIVFLTIKVRFRPGK